MARAFLIFFILYIFFFFGILGFRQLTGKEKWEVVKMLTYSAACATLAFIVLVVFVLVF
jgi:hypothetical protein